MNRLTLAFMVGTGAAVAVSFAARRAEPKALRMALVLAAGWALCIWLHAEIGPSFRRIYPVLDFIGALFCALLIVEERGRLDLRRASPWLVLVLSAIVTQSMLHVAYPTHLSREARYPYLVALNVLYAVQLIGVMWPGAGHVREHFRHLLVPGHRARPAGCPK